jgi:hypothetical protein
LIGWGVEVEVALFGDNYSHGKEEKNEKNEMHAGMLACPIF